MKKYIDNTNTIRLSAPQMRDEVFMKLERIPEIQLIYVSALACTRHRGNELVDMQRRGNLSYLLFDEIDMITGDYISKIRDASAQIASERNPMGIVLVTGCQSALLSTDYGLLTQEIEQELGIPVGVHDGCRLCGFDEEEPGAGAGKLNQLLYAFIRPADKSEVPSVNILGSAELDIDNELFSVLKAAGVKRINCLSACKSREEYLEMGSAHLNIITSAQDMSVGPYLQEKLGIPWVCLGGIYDSGELERAYKKLGEVFGNDVDVKSLKNRLDEKLRTVKREAIGCAISVEGDVEMAKWLLSEGFSVERLILSYRQGLTPEQRSWFEENAMNFKIESSGRRGSGNLSRGGGARGGRGEHGGRRGGGEFPDSDRAGRGYRGTAPGNQRGRTDGGSGRGRGQRGRGARGPEQIRIGYMGSMEVLESLKQGVGGAML